MKIRILYTIGFLTVFALLSFSIYLQLYAGFEPCPLCTLQRIAFSLLGIWLLIGIISYSKLWRRLLIDGLCAITAVIGILLSGRQVWLQHFPPSGSAECGVSLQYMLQALPVGEAIKKIFTGTSECSQIGWEFLHLNMAEWSLIWFILFLLFALCCALEELKWKP